MLLPQEFPKIRENNFTIFRDNSPCAHDVRMTIVLKAGVRECGIVWFCAGRSANIDILYMPENNNGKVIRQPKVNETGYPK